MNSLFAKILTWFWCTLAITLVGSAVISAISMNPRESRQSGPGIAPASLPIGGSAHRL